MPVPEKQGSHAESPIKLLVCECGERWFGGNTKYCPSGHAYKFHEVEYAPATTPDKGLEWLRTEKALEIIARANPNPTNGRPWPERAEAVRDALLAASPSSACETCGGRGYDAVQSTRGPLETDKIPCPDCQPSGSSGYEQVGDINFPREAQPDRDQLMRAREIAQNLADAEGVKTTMPHIHRAALELLDLLPDPGAS